MPVVIGGLILSFLVMLLFGGTELDRALLTLLGADAPRLRQAAEVVSWLAGPLPLIVVTFAGAGYLIVCRRWREAALLLALILLGRLLVDLVQWLTSGVRPDSTERLLPTQLLGYPNVEAANATITVCALAFLATRHFPARALALSAAAAFALAAGGARLILGASWPSDVIGGWAFGLFWVLLPLQLLREDLTDGTARPVRHSLPKGESHEREPEDRNRPLDRRQGPDREP